MNRKTLLARCQVAAVVAIVLASATTSQAQPITIPSGLNPGDSYRLAFVTSTTRDATSSNSVDYDALVTAAASSVGELASLGTTCMQSARRPRSMRATTPTRIRASKSGFRSFCSTTRCW